MAVDRCGEKRTSQWRGGPIDQRVQGASHPKPDRDARKRLGSCRWRVTRSRLAVYEWHTNIRSREEPRMATTTKMPAATHQRGIPAAGLLGTPAVRLGSVVERSAELSDEVLESLEAGQRAAIDAAGRFRGHRRGGAPTRGPGHVRGGEDDHRVGPGDGRPAGPNLVRLAA